MKEDSKRGRYEKAAAEPRERADRRRNDGEDEELKCVYDRRVHGAVTLLYAADVAAIARIDADQVVGIYE